MRLAHIFEFSRTSFYYKPKMPEKDALIAESLLRLHTEDDDTLGSRKLSKLIVIGRQRARRVMHKYQITARKRQKGYVYPGKSDTVFPNLLRDDSHGEVKKIGVYYSDIFEFSLIDSSIVYGCFVLKKDTRQITGLAFDYSKDAGLITDALSQSSKFIKRGGVFHSDQGKQYGASLTVSYVKDLKLQLSMSRAGTPTDNPYAERFVGVFKHAVVEKRKYFTLGDFLQEAFKWVNFYNNKRPHEGINMQSPNDYATEIGEKTVSLDRIFRV